MAREVGISSDPADAQGGFLDGVRGKIVAFETVIWDYAGKREDCPAIRLDVEVEDREEPVEQHLSAGKLNRIRPKKDGSGFCQAPGSAAKGLGRTCNAALFLASLVNAGFPAKKLSDFSNVVGLDCDFVEVPQPDRSGIADDTEEGDEPKRPRTVVNVSEIHSMPGEGGSKKKTRKRKPVEEEEEDEPEEEAEEESSDEISEEAEAVITKLLKVAKHKKGIEVEDLPSLVLQQVRKSPNKRKVVEMVQDEDWLTDDDRGFSCDGETVTK